MEQNLSIPEILDLILEILKEAHKNSGFVTNHEEIILEDGSAYKAGTVNTSILKEKLLWQEVSDEIYKRKRFVLKYNIIYSSLIYLEKKDLVIISKAINKDDVYSVSMEGIMFEGFVNQKKRIKEENERALLIQERQMEIEESNVKRSTQMTRLTRWISFGTLMAAIYYLIEIGKHFGFWK